MNYVDLIVHALQRGVPQAYACVLASLLGCGAAHASETAPDLFIGGAQSSSESSYSYLGVIRPVWGGTVGDGWFGKAVASWLTYRYATVMVGRDVDVRASAPGIDSGLGYAWRRGALSGDVSLAVGVRNARLRPDVTTDRPKGTRVTLTPQMAARYDPTPSAYADMLASYSFGTRGSFVRARLALRPASAWRAGLEGTVAEGADYRTVQRGVFAGTDAGAGWSIELHAGQARARDGHRAPYGGLSVSKML